MKHLLELEIENQLLRDRVTVLEAQNEALQLESNKYLRNWIAAQELATNRMIQSLCGLPATAGTDPIP